MICMENYQDRVYCDSEFEEIYKKHYLCHDCYQAWKDANTTFWGPFCPYCKTTYISHEVEKQNRLLRFQQEEDEKRRKIEEEQEQEEFNKWIAEAEVEPFDENRPIIEFNTSWRPNPNQEENPQARAYWGRRDEEEI